MKHPTRRLHAAVCLAMVLLMLSLQLPAMASVSGSTSMATRGSKYAVTADCLNFRSGPGTNYAVITGLKEGTTVTYLEYRDSWWRVKTADGRTGYVDRKYLAPISADQAGKYFVTASSLRVRKSPTTSSATLGTVAKGTMLTITELNGDWGYVSSGAGVKGWVALKYVSSTRPTGSSSSNSYTVIADTLNVRAGGSTGYERIDALKYGANVSVTRTSGSWGRISYKKGDSTRTGWVKLDYLRAN